MDQTSDGVLYVATKADSYVEEAYRSAESVKRRYPSLPTTLFTDRPEHRQCSTAVFDRVEYAVRSYGVVSRWAEGQLNRLRCLPRTPYARTLHLDTDTLVLTSELPSLFDRLDRNEVAMVETTVDDSYARYHLGLPMFNAGVILYRRTPRVWRWLAEWAALSERNFRVAARAHLPAMPFVDHVPEEGVRRKLLCMDQTSLTEIFSPAVNRFGLVYEVLDSAWNYRGPMPTPGAGRPVHILHAPRPPRTPAVAV